MPAEPAGAAEPAGDAEADSGRPATLPITFEEYRDWRLAAMERRRSEIEVQLSAADLPAARKARLEETRSYYKWLAGLPEAERDKRFRERFDRIDANHDGVIDAAERAAWRERQRAFYGGAGRGGSRQPASAPRPDGKKDAAVSARRPPDRLASVRCFCCRNSEAAPGPCYPARLRSGQMRGSPRWPGSSDWTPEGVIPAVLLPFRADFSIDEPAYRAHLREVAAVRGISAITVNGHSSEVHACTVDEQREVLRITMAEIGDRLPVVAGVYADGSLEAARLARMAEAGRRVGAARLPAAEHEHGRAAPAGNGASRISRRSPPPPTCR